MHTSRIPLAVIGGGWIGALADAPGQAEVLSHCHAYADHPRLVLVGVCDPDPERAAEAGHRWGCASFTEIKRLMAEARPEVVAVCTPTATHAEILEYLLTQPVRLVVAEKPLTPDVHESARIVAAYERAGVPLLVNMIRRFDPAVTAVRARLQRGELGEVLHATLSYTKGILHNGCHAVDLARYLFGEILEARTLAARFDHTPDDPSLSAFLVLRHCPQLFLLGGDERAYSLFELDVVATRGRVRFLDCGLVQLDSAVEDDPVFPGYRRLGAGAPHPTGLSQSLAALAGHLCEVLDGTAAPLSTGDTFLEAQRTCQGLLDAFRGRA